ncbi:MAG: M28 family peptidase [candidate division Zixibacteria bacterium]
MVKITSSFLILLVFGSISLADDLYRVSLSSHADAEFLNSTGIHPVAKIFQGYLIVASDDEAMAIEKAGIEIELQADDIELDNLYIDARRDGKFIDEFPTVYEKDELRLVSVAGLDKSAVDLPHELWPAYDTNLSFQYFESKGYNAHALYNAPDLEYIMSRVNTDSLISYAERLQAFNGRVVDTDSNYASSQWIYDKLGEFGYVSQFDDFTFTRYNGTVNARNVVAIKTGLASPENQIILCAHFDAVPGSPGADDNGSGTAGVLELARILKDIETDLSFVFILFDAEEVGLYGSYHYAGEAFTLGDNIEYILNLDMIAHYPNSDSANLFHSDFLEYAYLCSHLGDSLLDLTVEFGGTSGGSDHYPFSTYGWEVGFLAERIFSDVYHSSHDSTTYMNFEYMTRMVKLAAATTYSIDYAFIPEPSLTIEFPDGVPLTIPADEQYLLRVDINELYGGQHMANSCQLHYWAEDGTLITEYMTEVEYGRYEEDFPALESGCYFDFYITVQDTDGFSFAAGSPDNPYRAISLYFEGVLFSDDFESDLGWSVGGNASDGNWERGIPGGSGNDGEPTSDYDGSGSCFLTGPTEGSDVDNGTVSLYSPSFDLLDGYGLVNFSFWFNNGSPKSETLNIYLKKQGVDQWVLVKSFGPVENASGGWNEYSFWVNHIYPAGGIFDLRIDAADEGFDSRVEAAVDAFSVTKYLPDPLTILDNVPVDWTMGQPYSFQLNAEGGVGEYLWADYSQGLLPFGLSISLEDGLISGIPTSAGTVDFTAWIGDEMYNNYEKSFTFTINESVSIDTETLPDGEVDIAYNELLEADGGTETNTWTEVGNGLESTGLTLSDNGILSGIVLSSLEINFTARVEDVTGSYDEREFSIEFVYIYIPGDANGDNAVNVGDAVFLINHVFKQGPAPYPLVSGDANCDNDVNVGDAVYIINHVFKGGPEPGC